MAGIMGVKRTPDLLPFCHPIAVTGAEVVVEPDAVDRRIRVQATVRARDRTGVEMEALTAAAVAAPQPVRHGQGLRSCGPDRRPPPAGEVRRQERRLPGELRPGAGRSDGLRRNHTHVY